MIGRFILNYPEAARRTGVLLALGLVALALFAMGVSSVWLGRLVPPLSEWLAANDSLGRLLAAVAIALILAANWKLLRLLPRRQQVIGVWLELFVLLMLFFYSFDLSFTFIAKKIGFLITQGVVTTLYISAISIIIATVIALASQLIVLAGLFQFSDGIQVAANGALRGLKDTRAPMAITLFAYWGVGMPVGWWLAFHHGLGARGMWMGLIAGLSVAALMLFVRFWRSAWRERWRRHADVAPEAPVPVAPGMT